MVFSAHSDIGKVRSQNEDSYNIGNLTDGAAWAVICDGMGGASGGKVASRMCTSAVSSHIEKGYREGGGISSVKNLLISAITSANAEIFNVSQTEPSLSGMGTTVVAAVINENVAVITHVGDSRAYLVHDGTITQLTKDHSMVQYMVDIGKISSEEAKNHPDRNVITRAVGIDGDIRVDVDVTEVFSGDILIICTDGLNGSISDGEILRITLDTDDCRELPRALVDAANSLGGRDNITVAAIKVCENRES